MDNPQTPHVDDFARQLGQYDGLPDAVQTRPATIRSTNLVSTVTFIVQTVRLPDHGDVLFVERIEGTQAIRIVFPPNVTEVISRQRDKLASVTRQRQGRRLAAAQRARGTTHRNPLLDPAVRAKALAARKAKAQQRRERKARRSK